MPYPQPTTWQAYKWEQQAYSTTILHSHKGTTPPCNKCVCITTPCHTFSHMATCWPNNILSLYHHGYIYSPPNPSIQPYLSWGKINKMTTPQNQTIKTFEHYTSLSWPVYIKYKKIKHFIVARGCGFKSPEVHFALSEQIIANMIQAHQKHSQCSGDTHGSQQGGMEYLLYPSSPYSVSPHTSKHQAYLTTWDIAQHNRKPISWLSSSATSKTTCAIICTITHVNPE